MRIGGFQKLTLVDFPGRIAASVFTQGCNFRCGYCHNPQLVTPLLFQDPLPTGDVLAYLNERRGKLEGVVITGGEPCVQGDLADFIASIKRMGFLVKLDTNGSRPEVLSSLIEQKLLDYVALDIKSSLGRYDRVTGVARDTSKIRQSIDLIINSGLPYQFRTTLVKGFCSDEDLDDIRRLIGGANHYVLQPFVPPQRTVDDLFDSHDQYTSAQIEALRAKYEISRASR